MSINLASRLSSVTTDFAGTTHVVWSEGSAIWHAVYDTNSATWINAQAIATGISENVTSLNLVAAPNLIQGSEDVTVPGLAVVWQQGDANNSDFYYSGAQYTANGSLQWLSSPQALTSDQVADLTPSVTVATINNTPTVVVVGNKVNVENAANQAIREDADLYSQRFTLNSNQFSASTPPTQPTADYNPLPTNGVVLGFAAPSSSTNTPQNSVIATDSPQNSPETLSLAVAAAASTSPAPTIPAPSFAWNSGSTYNIALSQLGWSTFLPGVGWLNEITKPFVKGWTLSGTMQGGQSSSPVQSGVSGIDNYLRFDNSAVIGRRQGLGTRSPLRADLVPSQKNPKSSFFSASLGLASSYYWDTQSDPGNSVFNLVRNSLNFTGSVNFPLVTPNAFYNLGAAGSLGLNLFFNGTPSNGSTYSPPLAPYLDAEIGVGFGGGGAATVGSAIASVVKGSVGETVYNNFSAIGLAIATLSTAASFVNGFVRGLDVNASVGVPTLAPGVTGSLGLGQLLQLKLEGGIQAGTIWGIGTTPNSQFLQFPITAQFQLGPLFTGVTVRPGWVWTQYKAGTAPSSAVSANAALLATSALNVASSSPQASVTGSLLTVNLGTTLSQLPQASDFTVTVTQANGTIQTIPVYNVLQGDTPETLILQLETAIASSEVYDYTTNPDPTPTSEPISLAFNNQEGITDSQGNVIANQTLAVTNNSPDTIASSYNPTSGNSQDYSNISLVLDFNTALNSNSQPDLERFTVTPVGSNTPLVLQAVQVTTNGVLLLFDSSVTNAQVQNVSIRYNNSDQYGNALTDSDNNPLGNFTINNGLNTQVSQNTVYLTSTNAALSGFTTTPDDYTVTITDGDGNVVQTATVQTVTQTGQGVVLTLNQAVAPNQNAVVSFNQIQTSSLVTGQTPPAATTQAAIDNIEADLGQDGPPTIALTASGQVLVAWVHEVAPIEPIAGFVNGDLMTLNFANDLGNTSSNDPALSQFTVTDQNNTVYTVENVSTLGNSLTLKLSEQVSSDTQLQVSYQLAPATDNNQNLFFVDATNTTLWVDNFSGVSLSNTTAITTAPQLLGAGAIVANSTTNQITLIFDQSLNGSPTSTDFTVQSNGITFDIEPTITVSDNTVILSVQPPSGTNLIGNGDLVSISYTGNSLSSTNGIVNPFNNQPVLTAPTQPTTVIKYGFGPSGDNPLGNLSSIPGSDGFNFSPVAAIDQNQNNVVAWVYADSSDIPTNLTPGEFYTNDQAQVINDSLNASDIYYSIYDSTSGQWTIAAPLAEQVGADNKVTLGMGPNGNLMAAWINANNGVNQIYQSVLTYDAGTPSWSTPQIIYSDASPDPLSYLNPYHQQPRFFHWLSP